MFIPLFSTKSVFKVWASPKSSTGGAFGKPHNMGFSFCLAVFWCILLNSSLRAARLLDLIA
jgi:hypothetical protein